MLIGHPQQISKISNSSLSLPSNLPLTSTDSARNLDFILIQVLLLPNFPTTSQCSSLPLSFSNVLFRSHLKSTFSKSHILTFYPDMTDHIVLYPNRDGNSVLRAREYIGSFHSHVLWAPYTF